MTVCVIGAGVSGLACAHRLLELGVSDIRIIEGLPTAGGLCRTVGKDEFLFDLGPHQLHTQDPVVVALLETILGSDLLVCDRKAGMRLHGKLLNYPLGLSDLLTGLPYREALASAFSFAGAKLRKSPPPVSFRDWVLANYGERLYRQYFEPYTVKVWGCDPADLSADCAEERLASQSLWDVIMSTLNISRHKNASLTHSPYQPSFFYPRRGIGMLIDNWVTRLRARGVTFTFNSPIIALSKQSNGFQVHLATGECLTADRVVSTAPVNALLDCMKAGGFKDIPNTPLKFRPMVFAMLGLRKPPSPAFHWIYYPDASMPFLRVTQFHAISPDMAPRGQASICTETTCEEGDDVWCAPDDKILRNTLEGLTLDGLIDPDDVVTGAVFRETHAYPLMHTGYAQILERTLGYLSTIDGLITTGRQGAFSYLDVCDLISIAFQAAERAHQWCQPVGLWTT